MIIRETKGTKVTYSSSLLNDYVFNQKFSVYNFWIVSKYVLKHLFGIPLFFLYSKRCYSKWLTSLFNWICETYWTWDTNRHQVWYAVSIAPAQKRVVRSKNRIFLSSFCKGSFDLLLLTWKDSCTAELGLSLSSEHGLFK